jgi:hypothetical protein
MQANLKNPPYIFARNEAGRMVQIAGSAGDIGRLANLVVPDERVIRHLRPVISYIEKLPPRHFEYGAGSGYRKYPRQPQQKVTPIELNKVDDLPLFEKR